MSSVPTNYLTATETLQLIKEGTVTAEQVIADHKQRYEERNEVVRAWVTVDYEAATQAAKDTKGLPLHGVMIAVKDIISTSYPNLCSRDE
jgi:Asp-tRNA(Asn)/Glu-tRNA(Gln) amidotransferase A subunit family amidase